MTKSISDAQAQTAQAFGYQWNRTEAFDSPELREGHRAWLRERFGDVQGAPWLRGKVLDVGCGAGLSAIELFGDALRRVEYVGVDLSDAHLVAERRFRERGLPGRHMRADMMELPFPDGSFDVILAEGVLHHTDSTERALFAVSRKLRPGGRILFYVYRRKGPIREFTDDFIREKLQSIAPEKAWKMLEPLTRLGIALGELNAEINVPEPIDLLQIPAGKINVQMLFYWHVAKMFYRADLTFDEMNHMNFHWFAPRNSHRQSIEEVREWCKRAGLSIEREVVEDAGISVIAVAT